VGDVKEPAFAQMLKKPAFPMIVILTAIQKNKSRPLSPLKFENFQGDLTCLTKGLKHLRL
jgi:hypothetical protein